MSIFEKDRGAIESDNETLENSDEWLLSEDCDGLDIDDEETTSDSGYEFDGKSVGIAENTVNRFEIHTDYNSPLCERIANEEDTIVVEQGEN